MPAVAVLGLEHSEDIGGSGIMKEFKIHDKLVEKPGNMIDWLFPKLGDRTVYASGDYVQLGEYIRKEGGRCIYTLGSFWAFSNSGWFTKIHYEKGECIGRGYGRVEVLKPFDAFLVFEDYAKGYDYGNTAVVIPDMRCNIMGGCLMQKNPADDRECLEWILLNFLHCVENRDTWDVADEKIVGKFLSYKRVCRQLINVDGNDRIGDADLYFDLRKSVERYILGSELKHAIKYSNPNGLSRFLKSLPVSDFVEWKHVTLESYEIENYPISNRERNLFREHDEYHQILFRGFGENGNGFSSVVKKLKRAGFKAYSDAEARKLLKKEQELLRNENARLEQERNDEIDFNIESLDKDALRQIVIDWSRLMGSLGKVRKISVNGNDMFFTENMAVRRRSNYDKWGVQFAKCLRENGFEGDISDGVIQMRFNVNEHVPEASRGILGRAAAYGELEVSKLDCNDNRMLNLGYTGYDGRGHCIACWYFKDDGNSFLDEMRNAVERYGEKADFDLEHGDLYSLVDRNGSYGGNGELYNVFIEVAMLKAFVKSCREFLGSLKKK